MNAFKDNELVTIQGRPFPTIGGRLRLVHETNGKVSVNTDLVAYELDIYAVCRTVVETEKGSFTGIGVATVGRDPKLSDALVELAETRAVARALRHAGIGPECCGAEEVGDGVVFGKTESQESSRHLRVVPQSGNGGNGHNNPGNNGNGGGHPGGNGGSKPTRTVATSAQLRAIRTLARQAGTSPEKACSEVHHHGRVEELSVKEASVLIDSLKGNQQSAHQA